MEIGSIMYYDNKNLSDLAKKLRIKSLKMANKVGRKGAHLGGGLSTVEIFAVLYGGIIKHDANSAFHHERDRVIISKGHCVLPYYAVLNEYGFLSDEELDSFEEDGSEFHGHATRNVKKGIEFSGGSLGLGFSFAVGVALAGKLNDQSYNVYVLVGDGEMNEGIVWEALMSASQFKLNNLTLIIDNNGLQYDGRCDQIMNLDGLANRLKAFGFDVFEVDGHDVSDLYSAFDENTEFNPKAIIANTVKGKGVSFMENRVEWHHSVLNDELFDKAMSEQG